MKRYIKLLILFLISSLSISCKKAENHILTNCDFVEVKAIANENKLPFCLILVDSTSNATQAYKECLLTNKSMLSEAIFNFVDIAHAENSWYAQWLNPIAYPLTCVFSSSGELYDLINGYSFESFSFLKESIAAQHQCVEQNYNNVFQIDKQEIVTVMNKIFQCRLNLNNGINIEKEINQTLSVIQYPYNLGLKLINDKRFNKDAIAKETSKLLLAHKDASNMVLYSQLFFLAEETIDINYSKQTAPRIAIVSDAIKLDTCSLGKPYVFEITVKNVGLFPLTIFDIITGCGCLKFTKKENVVLKQNEYTSFKFTLTPDITGEIERQIIIISDAVDNTLTEVTVNANVK